LKALGKWITGNSPCYGAPLKIFFADINSKGFQVKQAGWDTGLPVELGTEKN
jgi:hypothetical protein